MNKNIHLLLVALFSLCVFIGQSQNLGSTVRENYNSNWSFGAGINVVDDSGEFIGGIQDPSYNWNFSRPFYISAEHYFNNEFSLMLMLSLNAYKEGKQIDTYEVLDGEEAGYFSTELVAKYSFRDVLKTYKFDPYVGFGVGITNIGEFKAGKLVEGVPVVELYDAASSFNLVGAIGFNYWFSHTWGLNLNLAGKWHSGNEWSRNHKQYALGVVYFLE